MRFCLPIIIVAGLLAACQSTDLTPQQQVYQLQRQLEVTLDEVDAYAAQPKCNPDAGVIVACHDARVVSAAVQAATEADDALDQAEAVVRSGGSSQEVSIYVNLARAALARVAVELAKGDKA